MSQFCGRDDGVNIWICFSYRVPPHFTSPPYTPPASMQRSFSSPDSLQKHAMVSPLIFKMRSIFFLGPLPIQNVLICLLHSKMNMMCQQQMYQQPQLANNFSKTQRRPSAGGAGSFRQNRQQPHNRNYHQQNAWGGGGGGGGGSRHHNGQGGNRHHDDDRSFNRGYHDSSWKRYWCKGKETLLLTISVCSGFLYMNKNNLYLNPFF